jgi:polygalacturonase
MVPGCRSPRNRLLRTPVIVGCMLVCVFCAVVLILGCSENREFNVMDYGAAGDGTADDAGAIQAAIESAADAAGTVILPPGTFLLGTSLVLRSGIGLAGSPGETTLTMTGKSSQTFMIEGTDLSGVSVHGIDFRAEGHDQNVSGLFMVGAKNCRATSLRFEGLFYGMKLGSGNVGNGWVVSNIMARDCLNPLYASHIRDSEFSHLDLQAVRTSSNQYHTVYLEQECRDLRFTDCLLSGGSGYTLHLWITGGSSSRLQFVNLALDATAGRYPLVVGTGWSNVVFRNSILQSSSDGAVAYFYGGSDVIFDGFLATGGTSLAESGPNMSSGIIFRNGVYEGSQLGRGATFQNVTVLDRDRSTRLFEPLHADSRSGPWNSTRRTLWKVSD